MDYDKQELIEGVTDLPDQSAADASCTRALSHLVYLGGNPKIVVHIYIYIYIYIYYMYI